MATLKDLKKKLEEAQNNVTSLEKEVEQRTPSIVTTMQFETFDGDRVVDALRKWASKYPTNTGISSKYTPFMPNCVPIIELQIRTRVTPDMLRSLADMMEENV